MLYSTTAAELNYKNILFHKSPLVVNCMNVSRVVRVIREWTIQKNGAGELTLLREQWLLSETCRSPKAQSMLRLKKKKDKFDIKNIQPWLMYLSGLSAGCEPKVTGSIPSQGTCLGCRLGPQWGPCERQPHIDVSLPLFLPPSPSL